MLLPIAQCANIVGALALTAQRKSLELVKNTHHVFRIMYHFVWIPKYRHKVFDAPYRDSLKLIIQKIGYDYNIEIVELEIPVDYIHMIIRSEPKIAPSQIMQIIKSISARNFFALYPDIKSDPPQLAAGIAFIAAFSLGTLI